MKKSVKYEGNSYSVAPFCWTVDGNAVIVTKNTKGGIMSLGLLHYRNNEAAHDAAWKLANTQARA